MEWNSSSAWRREWAIPLGFFHAFGEDIFGNQLVIRSDTENVFLWNHENGSLIDLLVDPGTLLEVVLKNGLSWIDFYTDDSLKIAEAKLREVPLDYHLHWTAPLILGGRVNADNTSIVDRSKHLVGHAQLWRQIRGLDPGTIIIPTRKPTV
jgi:hypothetical protein